MSSLRLLLVCSLIAAVACRTKDTGTTDTGGGSETVDADGDGFNSDEDCDDEDASIFPGADEVCDGIDNDCDGETDEDADDAVYWYADADGDGYGDPEAGELTCDPEDGWVQDATDCDDTDAEIFPGADERCDGVDNDCDGVIDEDLQEIWYADADGDGYGNADNELESCDPGEGWVSDDTDCDDANSSVNPGAKESCNEIDDDCDGEIDEELLLTFWTDADGDGFGDPDSAAEGCEPEAGQVDNDGDCDDSNSDIHPDAIEACNGYDDDCDGLVDDEDPDIADMTTWYQDDDGDGYGQDASTTQACELPKGYAEYGGDCDDTDTAYNPGAAETDCTDPADYNCDGSTGYADDDGDGWAACEDCDDTDAAVNADATELCNGIDDDCDGDVDEDDADDAATWYADADGDGYGDASITTVACDQPTGYVADSTDCDDTDAAVSPSAAERCNGIDDDCDGDVDEGVLETFYADLDGDGFGDASNTVEDCTLPSSGYVTDDTDCDDTDGSVYPGADEYCNGYDDDCDGSVDETDAVDASTWYADRDADGYGDATSSTVACDQPSGYVADDTDCDDYDDDIHPGADEVCDGDDNDCDGDVDENGAVDGDSWYADADGDGYGDASDSVVSCSEPTGYVADDSDCDDTDASINPAATEICDGIDNDCDGAVDDDDPDVTGTSTWYVDYDGDGYGGALLNVDACVQPSNYVADSTDCDDSDAAINPAATETCDGADNDCDGSIDEGFDSDADGTPDCFDSEECDGVDNDGDGVVDEDDAVDATTWYADADGDGYGSVTYSTTACDQPSGYVADDTDCDDTDAAQHPGADEYCNGEDDDCDGDVDDDGEVLDGDTYWLDADGDGTGDAGTTIQACDTPSGYADNDYDCNDSDASEPIIVDIATGSSAGTGTIDDPLDSIQDGINMTTAGCVLVFPGTYAEAIDFDGRDLSLTGIDGAASTIIDASSTSNPVVTFDSGEGTAATLSGFTLTGGTANVEYTSTTTSCSSVSDCHDYYYVHCGGGVYVNGADPTLTDLVIQDNILPEASVSTAGWDSWYVYSYGGGVCLQDSLSSLSSVEIVGNFADQGGGLYADEGTSATLSQIWLHGNSAADGASIKLEGGSVGLTNVLSTGNTATTTGGGLLVEDGTLTATNVTVGEDDAPTGAGIYAAGASTLDLNNAIVYGAATGEGVLLDATATLTATYNDVYGNAGGEWSGVTDPTGTDGNISEDPLFTDSAADDWTLGSKSPCLDAGDASILDPDGSASDMGAYGGPGGDW